MMLPSGKGGEYLTGDDVRTEETPSCFNIL
jgi:hypothetical protein